MRITVIGRNLPRRTCVDDEGRVRTHVHVAVQVGPDPVDPVPVTADGAHWELDVRTVVTDTGTVDLRGPAVHGRRGERFLYLTWGELHDGTFAMFRRAKLVLDRIDPELRARAVAAGRLAAEVDLTGGDGTPRCARVDPPAIRWWVPDATAPGRSGA